MTQHKRIKTSSSRRRGSYICSISSQKKEHREQEQMINQQLKTKTKALQTPSSSRGRTPLDLVEVFKAALMLIIFNLKITKDMEFFFIILGSNKVIYIKRTEYPKKMVTNF